MLLVLKLRLTLSKSYLILKCGSFRASHVGDEAWKDFCHLELLEATMCELILFQANNTAGKEAIEFHSIE